MKGVVPICLNELVMKRFGNEQWRKILEAASLPKTTSFLPGQDVDDPLVVKLFEATCTVLNLRPIAAAEAFGEYWCCEYAPRIYEPYFRGIRDARQLLLRMKEAHRIVTATIPNAHPPEFSFGPTPNKLIMRYASRRGLGDIFEGLVKGVGRHFREDLRVSRIGANAVEVTFAA